MQIHASLALLLVYLVTVALGAPVQRPFMNLNQHGEIWSMCGDPATHTLHAYENGVHIEPEHPQTGSDINVSIDGHLSKQVTGGKVQIDLKLLSMIKINKELDLCSILQSDVMGNRHCPLPAGDLELRASAFIPRDIPKLPLTGDIRITDQDNNVVTCIHLDFKLQ